MGNQKELHGWYPLSPRGSSTSIDHAHGSLKIRLQWIYSVPGLLEYFIMTSEQELKSLRHAKIVIKNHMDSLNFSKKRGRFDISLIRTINYRRNETHKKTRGNNEKAQKIRIKSNAHGENVIYGDKWNLKDVAKNVRRSVILSLDNQ